uniref:Sec20 C-terminal domain-containing protein n=2 Tax=Timema TaxID=61471 RepID=A0A7R9FYS9_TIMSH|nr:unnamed protein product [Timema shepardi]
MMFTTFLVESIFRNNRLLIISNINSPYKFQESTHGGAGFNSPPLVVLVLMDINHCTGPLELLNELNCEGRTKLAALRKHIDRLDTLSAFRKANVACLLSIERQKKDKKGLVKISSNVTEQLLSISRHLADTTQRSADTLDSLANSSGNVQNTQQELLTTGSVITQSGKLLDKYGRREFTDKVLLFFAFAFFLACVVYIVQKRIF